MVTTGAGTRGLPRAFSPSSMIRYLPVLRLLIRDRRGPATQGVDGVTGLTGVGFEREGLRCRL